jgi:uncharacterized protein YneF (UPF0154 family)
MKNLFAYLRTALEEDPGVVSAVRVALLLVVVAVVGTWTATSIIHRQMQEIPTNVLALVVAHLTAKVGQKFGESK